MKNNRLIMLFGTILIVALVTSGIVYAVYKLSTQNKNANIKMQPSFVSTLDENTINNVWIGTTEIAWQELSGKYNGKIEFKEKVKMTEELDNSKFTKDMLSKDDYTVEINENELGGYTVKANLNKKLTFLEPFDNFNDENHTFGDNTEEYIKYFGINSGTLENRYQNVEILFYNSNDDFAVKLKTKENDEIILYRTDTQNSFDGYFKEISDKESKYTRTHEFTENDELLVPYVKLFGLINYDEICGIDIVNSDGHYIKEFVQDVNFYLNESGCNLQSSVSLVDATLGIPDDPRICRFDDTFIIFMKESDKEQPYFALKVDNTDILEKKDEQEELEIIDFTETGTKKDYYKSRAFQRETKFFEDENYEYYFSINKISYVRVYGKDLRLSGETIDMALKNGDITIDLLDKFGIEYIKKEK